jgi:hypothetical protein
MTGKDYWTPFGKKRWSAVRILSITAGIAEVTRVDALTNEAKARITKVEVTQLLKRDPALKGTDKPTNFPEEMFVKSSKSEETRTERIARLLSWIGDDATVEDW